MTDGNNKDLSEGKSQEEIEKELVEQAEARAIDPLEAAATGHGLYAVKFKQGVDQLSGKGAKRLLKALVDNKVSKKNYSLQGIEPMLLEMGNFALECRFLMEMHTYNENREALEQAADPNIELTEEEQEEIRKELDNG